MKNYLDLEPIEENFILQLSAYEIFEDMLLEDKEKAIEYIQALCRYCFYGEEYEGNFNEIKRQLRQQSIGIDNSKIKYQQARKGGRGKTSVSDGELWEAWQSGEFKSKAELGRAYNITGQAVGQRLAKIAKNRPQNLEDQKKMLY